MNDLLDVKAKMTSLEIATLVESRHDKVKQSIERLSAKDVIKLPPTGDVITGERGPKSMVYVFAGEQGKRDSIIVVAQLSPQFTARLVDRWMELESASAFKLPNFDDPIAAARAWIEEKEKVILLSGENTQLKNKIKKDSEFTELGRTFDTGGLYQFRDWISAMKDPNIQCIKERAVIKYLIEEGMLFRNNSKSLRAYAEYDHYFKFNWLMVNKRSVPQLRITGLGIKDLTEQVCVHFYSEV